MVYCWINVTDVDPASNQQGAIVNILYCFVILNSSSNNRWEVVIQELILDLKVSKKMFGWEMLANIKIDNML